MSGSYNTTEPTLAERLQMAKETREGKPSEPENETLPTVRDEKTIETANSRIHVSLWLPHCGCPSLFIRQDARSSSGFSCDKEEVEISPANRDIPAIIEMFKEITNTLTEYYEMNKNNMVF